MGGNMQRIGAALVTGGVSEAFQKKPFQNLGSNDQPTTSGATGIGRFAPIVGITTQTLGSPAPKGTDEKQAAKDQAQALGDAQAKAAAQAEQDRLAAMPQSGAEEYLARKRATAARSSLGGASSYLTGTLG